MSTLQFFFPFYMFLEPQKYKVYADCRLYSYSSPSTPTQNPSRQTVSNRLQTRGERIYLNTFSNHSFWEWLPARKKNIGSKKKKAFQCGSVVKNLPANVGSGDVGLIPARGQGGGGKIPCSRKWQHTSVFLPGKLHGGLQSTGSQRIWHNQQLSTRAGRERAAVWLLSYILQFYPSAHLLSQSPESSVVFLETSAKCLVPPKFF